MRSEVAKGKLSGHILDGPPVHFRVWIDEEVKRLAFLVGAEAEVPAVREKDTVCVVSAEEIIVPGGLLPRFGCVHRDPAGALEIELGPAVVTRNFALGLVFGEGEADFKARRNAGSAHHPDEDGMKIGAITALRIARPKRIAAPPALAGFVVSH